jgi:hypothetical protein
MGWDGMRPGVEMSSRDVSNFVNGSEQTKQSFGKKEICTSQISNLCKNSGCTLFVDVLVLFLSNVIF